MCSWSTVSGGFLRPGGGAQGRGGVSRGPGLVLGGRGLCKVIPGSRQPTKFIQFWCQTDRVGSGLALQHPIAGDSLRLSFLIGKVEINNSSCLRVCEDYMS